jgi:6-pyruvoyltetrahydropterin/6-carboxytetrahydropterin synthase
MAYDGGTYFAKIQNVNFDAAHFVPGHPKCGRLHGHTYKIDAGFYGQPDKLGMVADFGVLRAVLKEIADQFDHKTIVPLSHAHSKMTGTWTVHLPSGGQLVLDTTECHPMNLPPTAENLAGLIWHQTVILLAERNVRTITRICVDVYEGLNKHASYERFVPISIIPVGQELHIQQELKPREAL